MSQSIDPISQNGQQVQDRREVGGSTRSPIVPSARLVVEDGSDGTSLQSTPIGKQLAVQIRRFHHRNRLWWSWFYIVDWLLVVATYAVALSILLIEPSDRYGPVLGDPAISHPLVSEMVPSLALNLIIYVGSLLVFISVFLAMTATGSPKRPPMMVHDMHHFFLGLLATLGITMLAVNVIKLVAVVPRPNFIALCQPIGIGVGETIPITACSNSDTSAVYNAFRAFPSGHASQAFAAAVFVFLYLCGKFGPLGQGATETDMVQRWVHEQESREFSGESTVVPEVDHPAWYRRLYESIAQYLLVHSWPVWKMVLLMIPIVVALMIAVSRVMDFHHSPVDIMTGGALGTLFALIIYHHMNTDRPEYLRIRFHPVTSKKCHMPRCNISKPKSTMEKNVRRFVQSPLDQMTTVKVTNEEHETEFSDIEVQTSSAP